MADKKISELTSATTPLAGTEVLPIVQSGSTVKTSVASLLDRAITINDSGANVDFRVESDTKTNALLLRGSDGFIGLDNSNPVAPLTLLANAGGDPTYRGELVINSQGGAGGINTNGGIELKQDSSGSGFGARFFQYFDGFSGYNTAIQIRSNNTAWSTPFVISRTGNVTVSESLTLTNGNFNALSGNITSSSGNFIVGTAGKGMDFSANTNAAGMTSELLNDYEEGTWTPDFSGWNTAPNYFINAQYTKIGRQVTVVFTAYQGKCTNTNQPISGLPFTAGVSSTALFRDISGGNLYTFGTVTGGSTQITSILPADFTGLFWVMSATYFV